jgi:hypothetical protein
MIRTLRSLVAQREHDRLLDQIFGGGAVDEWVECRLFERWSAREPQASERQASLAADPGLVPESLGASSVRALRDSRTAPSRSADSVPYSYTNQEPQESVDVP